MSKANLRLAVILLTVFTGIVHLVVLNLDHIDTLFFLNGIGYFVLLGAFTGVLKPLAANQKLVHYGLIGFAAATIIAFFLFNGSGLLGYVTKAVEVLLIVATYLHLQKS
ncbi:MAG: hypothetical protein EPO32_02460 [Anaerolineae bacterium]|nr:MAG: hypothetical protein EPO32_02460 [Anaerolineae bacterium]